jgi:hypothetical protein
MGGILQGLILTACLLRQKPGLLKDNSFFSRWAGDREKPGLSADEKR